MNLEWLHVTWADGTLRRTAVVSRDSDWELFDRVARRLESDLGGAWVERLDGLDERYWDFEAAGGKLTLHYQHNLGITLYIAHELPDDHELSRGLLEKAFDRLSAYDPT